MPQAVAARSGTPRRWIAVETRLPAQKESVPARQKARPTSAPRSTPPAICGEYRSAMPAAPSTPPTATRGTIGCPRKAAPRMRFRIDTSEKHDGEQARGQVLSAVEEEHEVRGEHQRPGGGEAAMVGGRVGEGVA